MKTATKTAPVSESLSGESLAITVEEQAPSIPEFGKAEVAKLKGSKEITDTQMALVERYRELTKIMAPYKAEQEEIKELLTEEMKEAGVLKLTRNLVVEAALTPFSRISVNAEGLIAHFPKVAAMFLKRTHSVRFDGKK